MDRAPAHMSTKLRWPHNIIQPAHSPELNPSERMWEFLKVSLKNQIFPSLQALRDKIQDGLDQLTHDTVMSLSSYDFILEALFYAASH